MNYQGGGQATCTRLLTLLVTLLICVPIGSEVAATDTTEAVVPTLRLEVRDHQTSTGGSKYALVMYPPIDAPADFCNRQCLAKWLTKP